MLWSDNQFWASLCLYSLGIDYSEDVASIYSSSHRALPIDRLAQFVNPLGAVPDVVPEDALVPSAARLPPGKLLYNNSVPVGGKFVDPNTIASEAATTSEALVASNARAVGCVIVTAGADLYPAPP